MVVSYAAEEGLAVFEVNPTKRGRVRIRVTTQAENDPKYVEAAATTELGDFALATLKTRPLRAYRLPPGTVRTRYLVGRTLMWAALSLASLVAVGPVLLLAQHPTVLALAASACVTLAVLGIVMGARGRQTLEHDFVTATGRTPMSHLLDERPAIAAATEAVNEVKAEYGRLLSDIMYRIECPALFDAAVPTTRDFTTAMIQWDNNVPGLPAAERATQAALVQLTFRAARAHAETTGMAHLPEPAREPAGRAVKALRVAIDPAATDGEKRASLARASAILADLALYYLPRPDQVRDQLEGRRALALPGRALPQAER